METNIDPYYALAHNLRGFATSTLRVKVLRDEGGLVWVMTADLTDAGTHLVLNKEQIERESELEVSQAQVRYPGGFVNFDLA